MMRKAILAAVLSLWAGLAAAQGVTVQQLPVDPNAISATTTFWCGDGAPPHTYQCPMPSIQAYGLGQSNIWTGTNTFNGPVVIAGAPLGTAATQNIGTAGSTVPLLSNTNAFGAEQTFFPSTTASASINIPQGVAPTTPNNGDCWTTSAGMYCFISGSTQGPYGTSGSGVTAFNTRTGAVTLTMGDVTTALTYTPLNIAGGTMTGELVLPASSTGSAGFNIPQGSAPTSPVNGDLWSTSAGFFGRIAGATVGPFGGGGSSGVSSFNTRTGAVTLAGSDVTTALGGTPLLAANNLSDITSQSSARSNLGLTIGTTSGTVAAGNDSRFAGPTQNSKSAAYTFVLTDAGGQIYHPSTDTTGRTWTIPANSSVAYAVGTKIEIVNDCSAGAISLQITSDTLEWFAGPSSGPRTIAACGLAEITKLTSTKWVIVGMGISYLDDAGIGRLTRFGPANDDDPTPQFAWAA
jgi:hypothetical protein